LSAELSRIVDKIWKNKGLPGKSDAKLKAEYVRRLSIGIEKGYGKPFTSIEYNSPDFNMISNLLQNVYSFSAAKNYTQLSQLTKALIDDNGVRTYSQFKKAAYEINDAHVNQWLHTEYDTAIGSAQMASKWVDITENNGTRYVEFDVVMDDHTSEICAPLSGLIVSVDDPILNTYYPPNHFNCRTTVRQHYNAKPTVASERSLPDIPKMFRVNMAKEHIAFPPDHAYYIGCPKDILRLNNDANYNLDESRKNKNGDVRESGIAYDPTQSNARYYSEYNMRLDVASALANHFDETVFITPDIKPTDNRYGLFFKNVPIDGKVPDFRIQNEYWELKSHEDAFRYDKISKMLRRAATQSENIILKLNQEANIKSVGARIKGAIKSSPKLKTVKRVLVIDHKNNIHVIK
jgi:SPP1 gp7 family putative phage head morphogenesis protein